jgi:hypothetical protein
MKNEKRRMKNGICVLRTIYHRLRRREEVGFFSLSPQAFICPKGAIPLFHFSNIPSFQSIVSEAN